MYRHGLASWANLDSGRELAADPHFGREIGALFHNDDLDGFSDAIVVADIADEQTVDVGATRADRKIFGVLWLESITKTLRMLRPIGICYEEPSIASESLMIHAVRNFLEIASPLASSISFSSKPTSGRLAPLTVGRCVGLKAEQG